MSGRPPLASVLGGCLLAALVGCTNQRQPFRSANEGELEKDPLLTLTFDGAVPRPLFPVGGDARPFGNEASVSRAWDYPPGASLVPADVLATVRSAGQRFDRVTCLTSGRTVASGLRAVSSEVGAQVYVDVDETARQVTVELVGQPAIVKVSTSTPAFLGCSERVLKASR